uniref:FOXP coiled-coil domain-containing protein n=1 Tax=Plectus sambesii TaxID=2011161 RepID=A0A914WVU6_9BILA
MCAWPSCEQQCDSYNSFIHHLAAVHVLDDRSTAQCRVQMEVVESMEQKLNKERQRLQAMMQHLQMKQSPDTTTPGNGYFNALAVDSNMTDSPLVSPKSTVSPLESSPYLSVGSLTSGVPATSAHTMLQSPKPGHSLVTSAMPVHINSSMDAFIKEELDNQNEASSSTSRIRASDSNEKREIVKDEEDEETSERLAVDDDDEDTKDAEDEEAMSPKLVVDEGNACADTSVAVP